MEYKVSRIYDGPGGGIYCDFIPDGAADKDKFTLLFGIREFYEASIKKDDFISDERFEELYEISSLATAVVKAQRLLSLSDHSKKQLSAKLSRYGIDRQYADRAALIMEERGFIDEKGQAERMALSYCQKKLWGKKRIAQDLLSKGYGRDAVVRAVELIPKSEYDTALRTVIEKKYPEPAEDRKEFDRRVAALIRLGLSTGDIIAQLKNNE